MLSPGIDFRWGAIEGYDEAAAQLAPHRPVDVRALDVDFYAITGHKLYGPTGIGALYAKRGHLKAMRPYQGGGEMIREVTRANVTYADPPMRFEAGTPPIIETVGLAAALDYLEWLRDSFDGDWLLAIAAYNCGEMAVDRQVKANQARGLPIDYWHLKLPRETQGYVPRLLCWVLLGLGVLVMLQGLRDRSRGGQLDETPPVWRSIVFITASLLVFAFAIQPLGVVIAIALLTLVGSFAGREGRPLEIASTTVMLIAITLVIFVWGVGLPIPVWPEL